MAFIRWKKNKFGTRHAYLIHSYRGEDGKPKHKTLAYLGKDPTLTPEALARLQVRHEGVPVQWEKIKPKAPLPMTDISSLSDAELLRRMRALRQERGIRSKEMVHKLLAAGVPARTKGSFSHPLAFHHYSLVEKAFETGEEQHFFSNPVEELAPFIRKVL